jgi:hypothetical protein
MFLRRAGFQGNPWPSKVEKHLKHALLYSAIQQSSTPLKENFILSMVRRTPV